MKLGERAVFTKQYARQDHLVLAEPGDKATIIGALSAGKTVFVEMDVPRNDFYAKMYVGTEYLRSDA